MKIITVNIKNALKTGKILLRLCAFVLTLILCVQISSVFFDGNELYVDAVSEITEKKTIIIDAGHGGEDCGAIGVNGIYEKDLNLQIATVLGQMLSDEGYAVVYTRTDDRLLYTEEENIRGIRKISDLKNRCKIAAEYENSIFVSIHMNSFSDSKYSGLHVYYSDNNATSVQLANKIQNSVKETVQKENNRVPKKGNSIYLLEHIENPAVLVECGFITNEEECEKLCEKEYQKELCFSILCGIIDYIKLTENA